MICYKEQNNIKDPVTFGQIGLLVKRLKKEFFPTNNQIIFMPVSDHRFRLLR
jgi:hypothetical protein